MKKLTWGLIGISLTTFIACQREDSSSNVVSQRYIHKYGFDVSKEEWENREKEGQVIANLENGVIQTQTFSNGILQGPSTYTYPNSDIISQIDIFDSEILLKSIFHDDNGLPYKEEAYEFDNKKVLTLWDIKGAPLSIEEYENDLLMKGQYFNTNNDIIATIDEGCGERVKYTREGQLISKDIFTDGILTHRTTYHSNGSIQSTASYDEYQLHGKQTTFSTSGNPIVEMIWDHGILDGDKIVCHNSKKVLETPFVRGEKHGIEKEWDENGTLIAEIHWKNDNRHGSSRFYSEEDTAIEWYYEGKIVSLAQYHIMEQRDKMVAELQGKKEMEDFLMTDDKIALPSEERAL